MLYILFGFLALFPLIVILNTTRAARLKHMARVLNLRYQSHIDNPLTALSAKYTYFFNQGFHKFCHVLTWNDSGAFIRVCEDQIYALPMDQTPQNRLTLVTVELMRGSFVPMIIAARQDDKSPVHPALPPELANRYVLTAPDSYRLSDELIGLLKNNPICYLETGLYSLVYHEYKEVPVVQIQQLRFRVKQFIKELIQQPIPAPVAAVNKVSLSAGELESSVLLTLQTRQHEKSFANGWRICYLIIMLFILAGILVISKYWLLKLAH